MIFDDFVPLEFYIAVDLRNVFNSQISSILLNNLSS